MKALLIAAALATSPATAKQWADDACFVVVTSETDAFQVYFDDGRPETLCTVADWPITSPIAVLSCDNGWKPEMQLADNGNVMALEDYILRVPTDQNGICD